jgi:hypothetical protein
MNSSRGDSISAELDLTPDSQANAEWCIGSDFRRKDVAVLECLSERDADGLSLKFGAAERVA